MIKSRDGLTSQFVVVSFLIMLFHIVIFVLALARSCFLCQAAIQCYTKIYLVGTVVRSIKCEKQSFIFIASFP